jgi:hypothetical protein
MDSNLKHCTPCVLQSDLSLHQIGMQRAIPLNDTILNFPHLIPKSVPVALPAVAEILDPVHELRRGLL